jgi:hypothetical protein
MSDDEWQIKLVSRTIGADRGRAARGRPGA